MPHVHQIPVCKHQHSRHSLATPASQLPRDHATWTTPPDSPAREIQNDGHHNCRVPKASPLTQCSQLHKTMRHLPRVAPSKIQCTNPNASQAAARHANHGHHNCRVTSPLTALPASQNNETPTTYSAVQHAPNNQVQRRQACEMIRDVDEVFKTYCASTMPHRPKPGR